MNFRKKGEPLTQTRERRDKAKAEYEARRDKAKAEYEDLKTWAGRVWRKREWEQERRQRERDAYVKKYRPIQTLDGLDPSPTRVRVREMVGLLTRMLRDLNV